MDRAIARSFFVNATLATAVGWRAVAGVIFRLGSDESFCRVLDWENITFFELVMIFLDAFAPFLVA